MSWKMEGELREARSRWSLENGQCDCHHNYDLRLRIACPLKSHVEHGASATHTTARSSWIKSLKPMCALPRAPSATPLTISALVVLPSPSSCISRPTQRGGEQASSSQSADVTPEALGCLLAPDVAAAGCAPLRAGEGGWEASGEVSAVGREAMEREREEAEQADTVTGRRASAIGWRSPFRRSRSARSSLSSSPLLTLLLLLLLLLMRLLLAALPPPLSTLLSFAAWRAWRALALLSMMWLAIRRASAHRGEAGAAEPPGGGPASASSASAVQG